MNGIFDVRRSRPWRRALLLSGVALALGGTGSVAAIAVAAPAEGLVAAPAAPSTTQASSCTSATCHFTLSVNPGLTAGHPFACPAIQHATASIAVTNRFSRGTQNDTMTLTASGLPPNTGFDLFLVEHSPFDTGFTSFGSGWYQSDVSSNSTGHVSVKVIGIFDKETFILNAGSTTPVHTFNVGFWFDSPTVEASKCPSAVPAATPFNGQQNAGLNAMITTAAPLGTIH